MDALNNHIHRFLKNKKRGPTSQRAHIIQTVCDTLFDDKHFRKILGQTRQFTAEEIRNIFDEAKAWQINPQALFWKLVREKQEQIRTQISEKTQTIEKTKSTSPSSRI